MLNIGFKGVVITNNKEKFLPVLKDYVDNSYGYQHIPLDYNDCDSTRKSSKKELYLWKEDTWNFSDFFRKNEDKIDITSEVENKKHLSEYCIKKSKLANALTQVIDIKEVFTKNAADKFIASGKGKKNVLTEEILQEALEKIKK